MNEMYKRNRLLAIIFMHQSKFRIHLENCLGFGMSIHIIEIMQWEWEFVRQN